MLRLRVSRNLIPRDVLTVSLVHLFLNIIYLVSRLKIFAIEKWIHNLDLGGRERNVAMTVFSLLRHSLNNGKEMKNDDLSSHIITKF